MNKTVKYIAAIKDEQQYLFRYHPGDEPVILKAIMQYAKSSQSNLDYTDVVAFVKRLRDSMVEELSSNEQL